MQLEKEQGRRLAVAVVPAAPGAHTAVEESAALAAHIAVEEPAAPEASTAVEESAALAAHIAVEESAAPAASIAAEEPAAQAAHIAAPKPAVVAAVAAAFRTLRKTLRRYRLTPRILYKNYSSIYPP